MNSDSETVLSPKLGQKLSRSESGAQSTQTGPADPASTPSLCAQACLGRAWPLACGCVVGGSGRVVVGPPGRVVAPGCRIVASSAFPCALCRAPCCASTPVVPLIYPAPPRAPSAQRPTCLRLRTQPPVTIQTYCIAIQIVPSQPPLLQYNFQPIKLYCNTPSSQASHLSVTIHSIVL